MKMSYTYVLNNSQQNELIKELQYGNYKVVSVPHTIIAAETEKCRINLYKSGKCLIQGKNAKDFIQFILEPLILKTAELGYEEILNPEIMDTRMGIDESGKGDFFGPLVIAGVYVDKKLIPTLNTLGVTDSKRIKSDKKISNIAKEIRGLLKKRFSIVKIGPKSYNNLHKKMNSVNNILAWGHARAIENLLDVVPHCTKAISDQFGKKSQVINALMKKGRKIELIQMHKAESDIAVAAASILARDAFVKSLVKLSEDFNLDELPKGCSAKTKAAAVNIVSTKGASILCNIAKCHFKTADEVLKANGLSLKDLEQK